MKQSISYYIILLVLKLKGVKKDFSKDPIDYKKVRKGDVHSPKGRFYKNNLTRNFKIADTSVTEVKQNTNSNKLLIFVHGGAFISGPGILHWDTMAEIAKHTDHTVWMCDYPKAPEHKITAISANIDQVYNKALASYSSKDITLIGDSVGATLITALTQRLILKSIDLPNKLILVSPVMDATMTNPKIAAIDKTDPMLSKAGVLSAKKMCAGSNGLEDVMISPINGSFDHFPHTILFIGTNDIMYPDQQVAVQKLKNAHVNIEIIEGEKMPHIWPFLPVMKEAKVALRQIIDRINS